MIQTSSQKSWCWTPIELVSKDDPPIYMDYPRQKSPPAAGQKEPDPTHSAMYGVKLADFSRKRSSQVLKYGWQQGDFHAERIDIAPRGTRFDMVTPKEKVVVFSPLIGRVNVYNILAASAAAHARGCGMEAIAEGVGNLAFVPGRFQRVDCGQPFTVVVDYAHTDDALRRGPRST